MRPATTLTAILILTSLLAGCANTTDVPEPRQFEETIRVPAGNGIEFKLHMARGDMIEFRWEANGPVFFDFHGEPDGAPPDEFTSHKLGDSAADAGTLIAPFTGRHGWYFENQGDTAVSVHLFVEGTFDVVGYV